jgi:hypothetical protein
MSRLSEFADVRFRVSEFAQGEPFISTEENGPHNNTILDSKTGFLMILNKGTTLSECERLVDHLNKHVKQISLQRL